jgi:hypothetical protein
MLNHPRNITMRAFLERLRPFMDSIKEGDNGDFYIDRDGIRPHRVPDIEERDALGLSNDERDALMGFEDECPLSFPCSEPEFIGWVGRILGIEIPASNEEPLEPLRSAECAHAEPAPEGDAALPPEEPEQGNALEQREKALEHWLESKAIPRREWPRLKSIHGMSRKTMYEELKGYPAFKSRHSGEPVSPSTFVREFWSEQGIASLD